MALKLKLVDRLPSELDRRILDAALMTVTELPQAPNGLINLKLVDDVEIRALNKKYGQHDQATDVLSFSYIEDGGPVSGNELGDIAISLATARRQAAAAGTDLETEVVLLLVHGTLHILGYDHANEPERAKMERLQSEIMTKLNLTYRDFKWDSSEV